MFVRVRAFLVLVALLAHQGVRCGLAPKPVHANDIVVVFSQNDGECPPSRQCPGPEAMDDLCESFTAHNTTGRVQCDSSWSNGFVLSVEAGSSILEDDFVEIKTLSKNAARLCGRECESSTIVFVFPDAELTLNVGVPDPSANEAPEATGAAPSTGGAPGSYGSPAPPASWSRRLSATDSTPGSAALAKTTKTMYVAQTDEGTPVPILASACDRVEARFPECACRPIRATPGVTGLDVACVAGPGDRDLGKLIAATLNGPDSRGGLPVGGPWSVSRDNPIVVAESAVDTQALTQSSFYAEFAFRHTFRPGSGADSTCLAQTLEETFQVQFNSAAHLVRVAGYWGGDDNEGRFVFLRTGAGVDIYTVDSTVLNSHSEFNSLYDASNRVSSDAWAFASIVSGGGEYGGDECDDEHATHVASIAAGMVSGIAKNATIVPVAVNPGCGQVGHLSDLKRGLQWIVERRERILEDTGVLRPSVVLMPIHVDLTHSDAAGAMRKLVEDMLDSGIVIVAAAGNQGVDACQFFPQSIPGVLVVGALESDDKTPLDISNLGPCINAWTVGESVSGASASCDMCTVAMTGTSQAAPIVAGMVAQFLQTRPSATTRDVTEWLRSNMVQTTVPDVGAINVIDFDYRSTI